MMNPSSPSTLNPVFGHQSYLVRRQVFKLAGAAFHIYDPSGQLAFYSKMKAFKLKEDIRVFTGEDMQTEVLSIQAQKVLDISGVYDVIDSSTNTKIGALQRKGMKSILKDEWIILDDSEREIGLIQEDNMMMALIRRFLTNIIPQKFSGEIQGQPVCEFKQNFNPFVSKIELDYSMDQQGLLDRRLGIAAAILLCVIEGKQN